MNDRTANYYTKGMIRINLALLCALLFWQCNLGQKKKANDLSLSELASTELRFVSQVSAASGRKQVHGDVRYVVYQLPEEYQNSDSIQVVDSSTAASSSTDRKKKSRIRSCYLQHGAGVNQELLESSLLSMQNFTNVYFGPHTVAALLHSVCDQVYVGRQESVLSSILEMTRRTELFMREVICQASKTEIRQYKGRICAYIGHSKGGAVAFNIARRCMDRISYMNSDACQNLAEIYSAAGVIQGAMLSFLGYGAYISKMQGEQSSLEHVLGFGLDLIADFYVAYVPGVTNPMWVDLSPAAPMEDGRPLYLVNNIALVRSGWLKADFVATGVDFRFSGDADQGLYGCAQSGYFDVHANACKSFGASLGAIHSNRFQKTFEKGLYHFKKDPRFFDPHTGNSDYLSAMNWTSMQRSDGLADYQLSLAACFKGLAIKDPRRRVVRRCIAYKNLNHLANAGGSPEALADMIRELSN